MSFSSLFNLFNSIRRNVTSMSPASMSASSSTSLSSRFAAVFSLSLIALLLLGPDAAGQAKKPKKKPSLIPRGRPLTKDELSRVKRVKPGQRQQAKQAATKIDDFLKINYNYHNVKPNEKLTDEQFLRRMYLEITGTIPKVGEARQFLNTSSPAKREDLIDKLLSSPGHVSHSFNYWANILRLKDRPQPNQMAEPYIAWIKESLEKNTPYDRWVHEMLAARGKLWENPATGYLFRDDGMALSGLDNTVRVFLGTQIGCAQCHDHPFDSWSQKQFYELAALTFPLRTRQNRQTSGYANGNPVQRIREELKKKFPDKKPNGTFNRLLQANMYMIHETKANLRYPDDYAYENAKAKQVVAPMVLFGSQPKLTPKDSKSVAFADWMTSRENERFTLTIANRLWKRAFGLGLIEPVDDIRDDSVSSHPELLKLLQSEMKRVNYDMKEFLRILYYTEAYQRQATRAELDPEQPYMFPGPVLHRMTAEQAWDSILTLAVYYPESFQRPSAEELRKIANIDLSKATAGEVLKRADQFDEAVGNKAMAKFKKQHSYKGMLLIRASEQPIPAPQGHFLREFGQGDRELIQGSSDDATVPQILTMWNGPITHMMLERGSVIYDNLVKAKGPQAEMDVIFLSVLSRYPNVEEKRIALKEMRRGDAGYGDVVWALINTREFLFVQ